LYREERRLKEQNIENPDSEKFNEIHKYLKKTTDELEEEEQPDPNRIYRWLQIAKNSLQTIALTKEVSDAAQAVWEAFKITF
jgi:hypothetical protein